MLKPEVIANLKEITPEEREILSGQSEINRNIYMRGGGNTVNSQKLLELGKLITVRKHTRFIDFPEHTHDYVELVYMLSGQTVHIVDGKKIVLKQGELLCMVGGKIAFTDTELDRSVMRLLKQMIKRDSAFLTVMYGEDVTDEQAAALEEEIRNKYGAKTEITFIKGGQPVYYYIISVE